MTRSSVRGKCSGSGSATDSSLPIVSHDDYPGDGIAPSVPQFTEVLRSAYDAWNAAASEDQADLFCIDSFLELVEGIPAFAAPPLGRLSVRDTDDLKVECTLEWKTTEHPECARHEKSFKFYQILGHCGPLPFRPCDSMNTGLRYPGLAPDRLHDLSCLILIWSYVLSCRWVEIFQNAGQKAALLHQISFPTAPDWDLILKCRWEAILITTDAVYYAPWMLVRVDEDDLKICDLVAVRPDTSSAFSLLTGFCHAKSLANECIVALALVLMLTSGMTTAEVSFPSPTTIPSQSTERLVAPEAPPDKFYDKLFVLLDKFLSLSSIEDGIDSLLCCTFFDPSVPCNFAGAQWLGVRRALRQSQVDPQRLAKAIATRAPKLSVLWLAVSWCEGEGIDKILDSALSPLATTNLLMATWTKTVQSFLQVRYHNMTDQPDLIPRTWEFSTAYFTRPDILKPFARAPPFGLTKLSNTSLEVRQHLDHHHIPSQWQTYWISKTGEKLTCSGPTHLPYFEVCLLQPLNTEPQDQQTDKYEQDQADKVSIDATSNLFYWHKNNEEGLWLDDGTEDNIEVLRKLQSHPWINCDFSGDEDTEDEERSSKSAPNEASIKDWLIGVEESCRIREPTCVRKRSRDTLGE